MKINGTDLKIIRDKDGNIDRIDSPPNIPVDTMLLCALIAEIDDLKTLIKEMCNKK